MCLFRYNLIKKDLEVTIMIQKTHQQAILYIKFQFFLVGAEIEVINEYVLIFIVLATKQFTYLIHKEASLSSYNALSNTKIFNLCHPCEIVICWLVELYYRVLFFHIIFTSEN